ncbi:peptide chain release factor N(5)-glutamine methyltransferase [Glaciecola siphonariae]|uniref:Release factor glutamine methyltransferase n=1 Tax=Glaciecola siphonariae TaxID=521012 RepID=A0ABV9LUR3_9ALTE
MTDGAKTLNVRALLKDAQNRLAAQTELTFSEPALEARLLFEHVSGYAHSWQIAHADELVEETLQCAFESCLTARLAGKPLAFITGQQDFWSLNLEVKDCTLIPRADTETLVEAALDLPLPKNASVLDLGTGTGAIALALAKESPSWEVIGVDRVGQAVALAKRNAVRNNLRAAFFHSHWFSALNNYKFDLIVSNPPYVEQQSEYLHQGDLRFEPESALVSGLDGLDDIRLIIDSAHDYMNSDAYLLLEHGFEQGRAVRKLMDSKGFVQITSKKDYNGLERVSIARKA